MPIGMKPRGHTCPTVIRSHRALHSTATCSPNKGNGCALSSGGLTSSTSTALSTQRLLIWYPSLGCTNAAWLSTLCHQPCGIKSSVGCVAQGCFHNPHMQDLPGSDNPASRNHASPFPPGPTCRRPALGLRSALAGWLGRRVLAPDALTACGRAPASKTSGCPSYRHER